MKALVYIYSMPHLGLLHCSVSAGRVSALINATRYTGESFRLNAVTDPMIPVELAPRVVDLCLAGTDPRHPYASPLYGDLAGLPPTLILVGSDEVLRDDAVRVADKMRLAGCSVEIEVWEHMWHGWHMLVRVMPEARAGIVRIAKFTQDKW